MHHIIAVALIVFSYLINFTYAGALIIFVHDIADVPGYAVKSSTDTSSMFMTLFNYFSLLAVWGYFRLYVMPVYLIIGFYNAMAETGGDNYNGANYLIGLLCGLQIMHVLWYCLFIQMGIALAVTGKAEDIQQKIEASKKKAIYNNNNNNSSSSSNSTRNIIE